MLKLNEFLFLYISVVTVAKSSLFESRGRRTNEVGNVGRPNKDGCEEIKAVAATASSTSGKPKRGAITVQKGDRLLSSLIFFQNQEPMY